MKKHAIIPIFIPHMGCNNDCVFCNQRKITSKTDPMEPNQVREIVDTWLTTLIDVETVEVAFFGGSFTGLPLELQRSYLAIAKEYKADGKISAIHLSTRPDYIDETILSNLKNYSVDVIELGVQSFDPEVLKASKRGHSVDDVIRAVNLIKEYEFRLGIQLMIGLPEDTLEKDIYSAETLVSLKPDIARLYPTIVIEDTELYQMAVEGSYKPLSNSEAVHRTKEMYKIIDSARINIIRVGLKSSDLISGNDGITGDTFHPAFRQLVEGEIAREIIELQLTEALETHEYNRSEKLKVDFFANSRDFSNMIGNSGCNKEYFTIKYPFLSIKFAIDNKLARNKYRVEIK